MAYGAADLGIDLQNLLLSIILAIFHFMIEFLLLTIEAKAFKSSILYYSIICLNGRLNWVPFMEKFS